MSRDLSTARNRRRIALNLAASVGCFTPRGWGQTQNSLYTGATGNWNTAGNWTPNGIPNNGTNGFTDYNVTVASNTSVDATLNSPVTIDTLTVNTADTLTLASGITMTLEGPTLMNSGTIVIDTQDSDANLDFAGDTTISGTGTIMLNDFAPDAMITATNGATVTLTTGTIDGVGDIDAPLISSGTIDANYGTQHIYINSPTLTNTGTMEATASGILEFEDSTSVTNTSGLIAATAGNVILTGTASITGGTLSSTGSHLFSVTGTSSLSNVTITPGTQVTIQSSELLNYGGPNLINNGTITIDTLHGDADLNFTSNTTIAGTGTMTLNDFGPNAKITGNAGVSIIQNPGSIINGTGEIDLPVTNNGVIDASYPAAYININAPVTGNGTLEVAAGSVLNFGTSAGAFTQGALSIASTGQLNIANNHLFIDYGSASDPISTILTDLKSGYNNGAWNGYGIISSSARTPTNGLTYSVGWADGNDGTGNVAGLSSGEIELKYTLLGDANLDGNVNGSDFSILAANFGLGVTNWDQGNFFFGSSVNGSDFSALATNFGQGDSNASVTPADVAALDAFAAANGLPAPTIAAVPEPATLGLLALGSAATSLRRRRPPR